MADEKTIRALEAIADLVRGSAERGKIEAAVKAARKLAPVPDLAEELSVWEKKLDVILKEPVGREGMARHVSHWIEKLKNN
ncbi:MAG: hypothetical protein HYZ52_04615 [Candidatus Omnitrophica bacterium]|nr:hypothetical protein [Candidatus Omnitrophota bacterium]